MSELTELYQKLQKQMQDIGASYIQEARTNATVELTGEQENGAEKIKERLKLLEEYEHVILWCKSIAEKHISSVNTLPIVPREIDMSRIRGWTRLIDLESHDDPYARRVYTLARSNELYIEKKRAQLNDILKVIGIQDEEQAAAAILEDHEEEIAEKLRALFGSDDWQRFETLLNGEPPQEAVTEEPNGEPEDMVLVPDTQEEQ